MQSERKESEADRQHKLQLERERLREYRQRIKQDPEKREIQRIRRKRSYIKQKENKGIEKLKKSKLNDELTSDEVSRRRRQWRIRAKKCRERKKKLKESSVIDEDSLPVKEEEKLYGNINLSRMDSDNSKSAMTPTEEEEEDTESYIIGI